MLSPLHLPLAVTPLVMARGHHVDNVPEFPLVINNLTSANTKTLLTTLQRFGVGDDLAKVESLKQLDQEKENTDIQDTS